MQDYSLLSLQSVANLFTPPQYWADTVDQMDLIGVGSLPIIIAAALSIGGVMVLNTASEFQRFGETALTGEAVSLALVRELGPAITALLVAGRNASGIASELGSMVVTEQVDAMRALGTDPIRKLMTPRVVAIVLIVPLLVAVFDLVGLLRRVRRGLVHAAARRRAVLDRAIKSLEFGDLVQGFVKPVVFRIHHRDGRLLSGFARHRRHAGRRPSHHHGRSRLFRHGPGLRSFPRETVALSCFRQ